MHSIMLNIGNNVNFEHDRLLRVYNNKKYEKYLRLIIESFDYCQITKVFCKMLLIEK